MSYYSDMPDGHYIAQTERQVVRADKIPVSGRRAFIEKRIARLEGALERIERFGEDVYQDEAVLMFRYAFKGNQVPYLYAAIRIRGRWYVTGRVNNGTNMSWDELVSFWLDGTVVELWEAAKWNPVAI